MTGFNEGDIAYVMRSPESNTFSNEKRITLIGGQFSIAETVIKKVDSVAVYYSLKGKYYRIHTEDNGVTWKNIEEINSYCDSNIIHTFPFSSPFAPSYLFIACKNKQTKEYFKVSNDGGATWKKVDFLDGVVLDIYTVAGNKKGEGLVAYGFHTVRYMKLGETKFKSLDPPPTPDRNICSALTSSYRAKKFFFWYTKSEPHYESSLWVVRGTMDLTETI